MVAVLLSHVALFVASFALPATAQVPSPKAFGKSRALFQKPGEQGTPRLGSGGAGDESAEGGERIPGHYIVVLKGSVEHPGAVADAQTESHNGDLGFVYSHALKGYSAELSKSAVEALRKDPRVKYVTPDRKVEAFSQTIPTGIQRIGATENATANIDGKDDRVNVDVAVIDTGVDYTHPDLNVYKRVNCVPAGEGEESKEELTAKNCIENSGTDGAGHGTHVAGIIGALDNGEGVVGVAPGARIWSVRVLNNGGGGTESWIAAGVDWVRAHASEIEVANMSLGCFCSMPAVEEAVTAAVNAGVVITVAAGNEGATVEGVSPAQNPNVITVSALADYDGKAGGEAEPLKPAECKEADKTGKVSYGSDDTLAWFSNWGSQVDVAAPGVCILSTLPGGTYGYESGTSMASPHVAGAAALLASKSNPNSKAEVEALRSQIVNEGSQNWNDIWTWGDQTRGLAASLGEEGEGSYDKVQEPLLDVRSAAAATYTTRATERTYTSATLNGGVNPNGKATTYQFEYGTSEAYGTKVPASPKSIGSGTTDVKTSEAVSGLKANTTYHYRLVSTGSGTVYGKDKTFKPATTLLTYAAAEIEASSATLEGRVNPIGIETSYQFEYVDDANFKTGEWSKAVKAPASPKGIGAGTSFVNVSQAVTGLKPATVYHYRVAAINKNGTAYAAEKTLTTPAAVIAQPATGIDTHRARLEASVNPIGLATTYQFEWGENKEYGHVVPTTPKSIGSGIKALKVSEIASGLKPNTTYHFRVAASSGSGTTYGEDKSFTTATTEFEPSKGSTSFKGGGGCEVCYHLYLATLWGIYDIPEFGSFLTTECNMPAISGAISGRSESLTAEVASAKCSTPAGLWFKPEASIEPNGCQLEFHPGQEGKPGIFNGSIDIVGTKCTGMTINFPNGEEQFHNPPYCKITIGPQHGIAATFHEVNQGKGAGIEVIANGALSYSQTGSFCVDGTFDQGGGILGGWDIYSYAGEGTQTELHLTHALEGAITKRATAVQSTKATLNGTVNPQGLSSTYQFEYVSAAKYNPEAKDPYAAGGVAPSSPASVGSGSEAVEVSQTVEGLGLHTTYHYRVVLKNSEGSTYGKDQTFTTIPTYQSSIGSSGHGAGQFSAPKGVAVDGGGNIWVADSANNRVQKFSPAGEFLLMLGGNVNHTTGADVCTKEDLAGGAVCGEGTGGAAEGELKGPADVAITAGGDVWVVDRGNARLEKFSAEGKYLAQFTEGEGNEFVEPGFDELSGVAVAPDGHIWVVDSKETGVLEYTAGGELVEWYKAGSCCETSESHEGIAVDAEGNPYLSDFGTHRVEKLNAEGEFVLMFGKGVNTSGVGSPDICIRAHTFYCHPGTAGSGEGQFNGPQAVDVEPSGNVLVTDKTDGRVQEFSPAGEYVSQFGGEGQIKEPQGIAVSRHGAIYVSDTGNNRVQVWCAAVTPEAITSAASGISGSEATLHGTANPGCAATTYQFEYGTTKSYGSKVPVEAKSIGSGAVDIAVSEGLQSLAPRTTYHFRLVATNSQGTSYGEDVEFSTWGAWSTQSTPNPETRTEAKLEAVSCPSATICVAAGNDNYTGKSTSQAWDGSEWKPFASPLNSVLYGISCPSTTRCIAVGTGANESGTPVAERWIASTIGGKVTWSSRESLSPPSPSGASTVNLKDVSCTSESACTAVGYYYNGTRRVTLAERWNGTSWSIQTTANPETGDAELLGVSCDSATSCTAVGHQTSGTFAERWNGTSWSISSTPNPAGGSESRLERLSCTSSSFCMAAGSFKEGTNRKTLAERWNGTTWSIVTTANPGGTKGNTLLGVSCASSTACIAVGRYVSVEGGLGSESSATEEKTLALSWGGSEWVTQTSANPEGKKLPRLTGVSCTASTACTAVGWAKKEKNAVEITTLGERWNGSSWSTQSTPNPETRTEAKLEAVSCPSATICVAAGNDNYTGRSTGQAWEGSEWKPFASPLNSVLYGIACPSTTYCIAVGTGANESGTLVAERWRASILGGKTNWSQGSKESLSPPSPSGASGINLKDVSCTSESACTAVGYYYNGTRRVTLAERWNGTSWSIQTTANPETGDAELLGVSCDSATSCTAVGHQTSGTFAERWNGTSWSISSTPNPVGASNTSLADVSCSSSTNCLAVGSFNESGPKKPLAERWNGTSWSLSTVPSPANAKTNVLLSGVSCPTSTFCSATGTDGTEGTGSLDTETRTLVESWSGSEWKVQTSTNVEGKKFDSLAGVSCSSATACTAVGGAGPSKGFANGTVTLGERYE
jgi:subtilisin family serine protease/sugar lactone lactonase YvrE